MRITESRLRSIIRSVIKEDFDLDRNWDGEGLMPSNRDAEVGVSISRRDAETIKRKYGEKYIFDASSEDAKKLAGNLKKWCRAKNINVLDPNDMQAIRRAHDSSPEDLLPLFVVGGAGNSKDFIVFKTVGSDEYYIRSIDQYGLQKSLVNKIIQPFDNTEAFNL